MPIQKCLRVLALLTLTAMGCSSAATQRDKSIEDHIIAKKHDFLRCYEKHKKDFGTLPSGVINVSFLINPDGSVKTASIKSSTLAFPPVENCTLEVIKKIHFDSSPIPLEIFYPFKFSDPEKRPNE